MKRKYREGELDLASALLSVKKKPKKKSLQ